MIVLIAPEIDIDKEIEILHQLFEEGLMYYHFRKPSKTYEEHVSYLNQINKKYHDRIVTHYFHELINEFDLKGIHFQEQKRIDALENGKEYFIGLNMIGKTMSSSFHEPEELAACDIEFDYHLLSPVFSSISKKGYEGRGFDVSHVDKTIIGMGGINASTIGKTLILGFQGIGVLGGVWNAENPVESFKEIKRSYEESTKQ
ncbi:MULTISPECIES: thiamine phosphate synthase [unclassified Tenacibaculum]|uniref:thiamine phosphate synthase n=1 Tax=unclassified Tenacibaculum TaxID=2635139 RepID=UPI001F2A5B7A|nr:MULTISPECIES: thiamine phosphate synthase [unclassified Tenacibaculum]MCF2873255.1 thiamine phosphate synthase [Tenacibaculum sp. Cn5-1]MCF2933411.1 thiamine phosphate synthase [Tenacibaculum sp. Cn5-34]MCG7510008.1 thiamine phosphate synthase [Tenacibaculum sp. Cn5-46]